MKLIWMSDLHFTNAGEILTHDPRRRLDNAIQYVNQHHSDAALCVISGDLVDGGNRQDYVALKARLAKLSMPYFPMVGNHDARAAFRELLPLPSTVMDNFVQYSISAGDAQILCLDTQKTGSAAGEMCPMRRAWVKKALQTAKDRPIYIFMHHPPMALGLPMQDQAMMEEGQSFLDLLAEFTCVKYLFIGHVHRAVIGNAHGIPFATMRSVLYQAPPPVPAWDWDSFVPSKEAPNVGALTFKGGGVHLQYLQFCTYEDGVVTDSG